MNESEMSDSILRIEAMRLAVQVYSRSDEDQQDGIVTLAQSIYEFFKSGE